MTLFDRLKAMWAGEVTLLPAIPVSHTRIEHIDGVTHVQRFGPEHVVEGSEVIIEVPVGRTVMIRHIVAEP